LVERERIVREVAGAVGLVEGERGVESVLAAVARLGPVSTRRLARAVDLPVPIVASVCGELRKRAVVSEERPNRLSPRGRSLFASGALRLPKARSGLDPLRAEMRRIARCAPPPRLDLDQCHCTAETKLRRVLALHEADALVGRRILLLGDDDLTSLAIAAAVGALGSRETIAALCVVDVDPEVVAHVRRELAGAPFPFEAVTHDLRRPLPDASAGRFDSVLTDPPYTVPGASLFLARALEALDARGGDVFLSFGSRRFGAALGLQREIARLGLAIVRLTRDFNEYEGAGVLAGTSSLYQLAAGTGARRPDPLVHAGPLYTADVAL
jgi:N4-bis(aminopropyl)spermidine synthase